MTRFLFSCLSSMLLLSACGGLLNGGAQRSTLETAGIEVRAMNTGWYEMRTPEGYHFAMPGFPRMQEESVTFGGADVPQRFFELYAQLSSVAYMVRVFDTRSLEAGDRQRLIEEGRQLFVPSGAQIMNDIRQDGRNIVVIDGLGEEGNHRGILHEFEMNGFVWFMFVVSEIHLGPPSGNEAFMASAGVRR